MIKKTTLNILFIVLVFLSFVVWLLLDNLYVVYVSAICCLIFLFYLRYSKKYILWNNISLFTLYLVSTYAVCLYRYFNRPLLSFMPIALGIVGWYMLLYCLTALLLPNKRSYRHILHNTFVLLGISVVWLWFYHVFLSIQKPSTAQNNTSSITQQHLLSLIDSIDSLDNDLITQSVSPSSQAPSLSTKKTQKNVLSSYFGTEEPVAFGEFISLLWSTYTSSDMSFASQNVDFSYIPSESALYPAFVYAHSLGMIGVDVDPSDIIKCKHMVVMLWLAQWWDISGLVASDIVDKYWDFAGRNSSILTYGCIEQNQLVIWSMLP